MGFLSSHYFVDPSGHDRISAIFGVAGMAAGGVLLLFAGASPVVIALARSVAIATGGIGFAYGMVSMINNIKTGNPGMAIIDGLGAGFSAGGLAPASGLVGALSTAGGIGTTAVDVVTSFAPPQRTSSPVDETQDFWDQSSFDNDSSSGTYYGGQSGIRRTEF